MRNIEQGSQFSQDAIMAAAREDQKTRKPAVKLSSEARLIAESFSGKKLSPIVVSGVLQLFEGLLIAFSGVLVHILLTAATTGFNSLIVLPTTGAAFVAVMLIYSGDGYSMQSLKSTVYGIVRVALAWSTVVAVGTFMAWMIGKLDNNIWEWLTLWYVSVLFALVFLRFVVSKVVHGWTVSGKLERRIAIVGGGTPVEDVIASIESDKESDIKICGVFDDRSDDRSPVDVGGYKKLGTVTDLVEFARISKLDLLVVTLPITAERRVLEMLQRLWVLPIDIRLAAHTNKLRFRPRSYSYLGAMPVLPIFDKPIADWDSVLKRCFDLVFTLLAIVLLFPIMIATAIAIKLESKGPVIFKQIRDGFNNEGIMVYKFRSLYHDQADIKAAKSVTKNDPRVTRVGAFIRRTSIDELPQLFNVLVGSLSLVGPRPHVQNSQTNEKLWEEVVDGYMARHRVKPGITGWAQINGWRGEVNTPEKLEARIDHDLYYIENWSLLFDLKILFLTPFRLFNQEGAY
ncbi:MAG: undecaprenyl-phosphate glucose phosphotransferase [Cohaesibacteraceae bacterium]|nr:undecaprenyl-phosphate glucose phosphotransferase [Cohaesibacteraceae bacterium]MBL4875530.1 undecaprenyl-phosphate glucose phosphotransferase [Cohaesibacteraceae bacterium]